MDIINEYLISKICSKQKRFDVEKKNMIFDCFLDQKHR